MDRGALTEAVVVGALGAAAGWTATAWAGFGWAGAAVGGANGVVAGHIGLYDWSRLRGWVGFGLDSTWGLFGIALGLGLGALNLLRRDRDYVVEMSARHGYHVFAGGLGLRKDFALALGNVIANAGGSVGLRGASAGVRNRRRFLVEHEALHVFQNRLFGPLYQMLYVAWVVGAGAVGLVVAALSRRDRGRIIETLAYYDNPFEYWAYRNNHYWPPRGAVKRWAWGIGVRDSSSQ